MFFRERFCFFLEEEVLFLGGRFCFWEGGRFRFFFFISFLLLFSQLFYVRFLRSPSLFHETHFAPVLPVGSLPVSFLLASKARLIPFAVVFFCSSSNPVIWICIHFSMSLLLPSAKFATIFRDPSVSSKCRITASSAISRLIRLWMTFCSSSTC